MGPLISVAAMADSLMRGMRRGCASGGSALSAQEHLRAFGFCGMRCFVCVLVATQLTAMPLLPSRFLRITNHGAAVHCKCGDQRASWSALNERPKLLRLRGARHRPEQAAAAEERQCESVILSIMAATFSALNDASGTPFAPLIPINADKGMGKALRAFLVHHRRHAPQKKWGEEATKRNRQTDLFSRKKTHLPNRGMPPSTI
ncbi:unnamed protein product [Bursaphelenchus xylophilus]|uniref:(pine wood nematode) hypothetical protein n=1 Tax=Bursaphelenchus xylophilus TaxID=6326 RepID=A0A1I7SQL4_BURXY|nr:unnamed protein product [Bursaphelenchus xylophilus]CAG9110063.1 unnamed protein product [Bursaphelenchus xylophilus]